MLAVVLVFFHIQVSGVFRLVRVVEALLATVEGGFSRSVNFLDPKVPVFLFSNLLLVTLADSRSSSSCALTIGPSCSIVRWERLRHCRQPTGRTVKQLLLGKGQGGHQRFPGDVDEEQKYSISESPARGHCARVTFLFAK